MKLFENTEIAFASKSDAALERAYFLFRLIANQPLVKIGTQVAQFALKSHLPVEGLIRATVFDHFCSGTSAKESIKVVNVLAAQKVYSVLDYSVEGAKEEISLDDCLTNILSTIELSAQLESIPFTVFKPTGFGSFELYEKVSFKEALTEEEAAAWQRVRQRFFLCCDLAQKTGMKLLIDAEESWIQPAINSIVEEMMSIYNRETAVVHTTAQMYLSEKLDYLYYLSDKAKAEGFIAGIKLVRGAYMEKERQVAEEKGWSDPICISKEATDINFNRAWQFILSNLDHFSMYFGSHNEQSTYDVIAHLADKGIPKDHPHLWFGQLYGMSDHISFNLANEGFKVSKYLPFGPVKDVLPYLIRRAEENTSVEGQTVRELELLQKERKRRKID
ncbi:MAG: proline dehydrogenase family protein [Flavobacteriaceae bacterium]|jgi:proline dehydrogenase|nr:proline dehydrogenase family protein [Flavobacteriaceae bacterium]